MAKVIDVTLQLVDKLSAPLARASSHLTTHANQYVKAGRQITKAGKGITSMGAKMTTSVTAPVAALGVAAVNAAAKFESGMDKVQSIAGTVSGKTMKEMSKSASEMGLSFEKGSSDTETAMNILSAQAKKMGVKTKYSASEAADAYSYMAMAGWNAGDMLNGIEPIMKLAGATGEDLATTSDIVTDALTAFGMTSSDTKTFVDILAKTASSANTNVSMLGESFKYVAPVAGSLGYTAADTSKMLGIMADSGIKASSAGTSLRSVLSRMSAPTTDVEKAMKTLGISMTDSSGNMKSLDTLMGDMRGSFRKLTETQKAQYASTLAGKNGMSGLLAVVNSSDEEWDKMTKAMQNADGAANSMYDTANANLNGQLTILKSTVESIAISFGEKLTPYVTKLTEHLQSLADRFNSLSDAQQNTVIKVLAVVASIGPGLLVFGKLVTTVGTVVSTIGKFGKALRTAGSLMGLLTSPAGIVIGVIAAIAVAALLIIKNWNKIKPFLKNVQKWFTDAFGGAGGAFEQFQLAFKNIVKAIAPVVSQIGSFLSVAIPKAVTVLKNVFEKVAPVLEKVFVAVVNAIAKVLLFLSKQFLKVIPYINKMIAAVKKAAPPIKNTLAKSIKVLLPILQKMISVITKVIGVIGKNLVKCIRAVFPVLKKLGTLFGVIFKMCAKKVGSFLNIILPIINRIIHAFLSIIEALQPAFSVGFDLIGGIVSNFANTVGTVFEGIMGVLGGIIDFVTGVFTGNWSKAWEGVKSIFSSIFSTFVGLAKQPINGVIGIINSAIKAMNKINVDIPDWVPGVGGSSFGINIPTIPTLAVGTANWQGGLVQISEKGGEIVDLPQGSRVYPHDQSVQMAKNDGRKEAGKRKGDTNITITIPKFAEQIVIREDADIDRLAKSIADKLEKVAKNMGGGEIEYSY